MSDRKSVTIARTDNGKYLVEVREYDRVNQTSSVTHIIVADTVAEAGVLMADAFSKRE